MTLTAVIACEIAFWVAVIGGLTIRYLLRRPRLGAGFLAAAPVVDVVLLAVVTVDLLHGATASWHHGVAAVYIGVSVAYGHRLVAWADVRFAHRFAGGPRPERSSGRAYTVQCWGDVVRTTIAALIAGGIIEVLVVLVGDPDRTAELQGFIPLLGVVVAVEFLWAVGYTIWPRTAAAPTAGPSKSSGSAVG
jgi:hypothetical protein